MKYVIFTDGACDKNPNGKGGWAAVILPSLNSTIPLKTLRGNNYSTTNNRMEIMPVLESLKFADENSEILIVSDSQYVVCALNSWLSKWVKKDFRGKKNVDLWREIYVLIREKRIRINAKWVKGHNNNYWNEVCDGIATSEVESIGGTIRDFKKIYDKNPYF